METILNWDIIAVSETWATQEPKIPSLEKSYNIIFSTAVRDKQKGHASGGLLLFIKK